MKGHRKVAVVEDFFTILKQVHDADCLHAGSKKTYAQVCLMITNLAYQHYSFLIFYLIHSPGSEFVL